MLLLNPKPCWPWVSDNYVIINKAQIKVNDIKHCKDLFISTLDHLESLRLIAKHS